MIGLLMALGAIAQIFAWRLVAVGALSIWAASVPALGACGVAALLTDKVALSPEVSVPIASVVGVISGFALFAATRGFLALAGSASPTIRRASDKVYAEQGRVATPIALILSLGIAVPGEELFWRGLFQGQCAEVFGTLVGALLAWGTYIVVNAASGFLALVAGAIVGGGLWGLLAYWTHGVLAPLLCHGVWTGLMLVRPPMWQRRAGLRV